MHKAMPATVHYLHYTSSTRKRQNMRP